MGLLAKLLPDLVVGMDLSDSLSSVLPRPGNRLYKVAKQVSFFETAGRARHQSQTRHCEHDCEFRERAEVFEAFSCSV